jgi:hypothetical protein
MAVRGDLKIAFGEATQIVKNRRSFENFELNHIGGISDGDRRNFPACITWHFTRSDLQMYKKIKVKGLTFAAETPEASGQRHNAHAKNGLIRARAASLR